MKGVRTGRHVNARLPTTMSPKPVSAAGRVDLLVPILLGSRTEYILGCYRVVILYYYAERCICVSVVEARIFLVVGKHFFVRLIAHNNNDVLMPIFWFPSYVNSYKVGRYISGINILYINIVPMQLLVILYIAPTAGGFFFRQGFGF